MTDFDEKKIIVRLQKPEKQGEGMSSYVTYEVFTRTSLPKFSAKEMTVRRRYSDFAWLRQAFTQAYPHCLIPPVPEKETMSYLDRFSSDFIEIRRSALERFLVRVSRHPTLAVSPEFQTFLEAKSFELETAKGSQPVAMLAGFVKTMTTEAEGAYHKLVGAPRELDPEFDRFENLRNYVNKFEEHVSKAHEVARRLAKRDNECSMDHLEFGPAFNLLAQSETAGLAPAFLRMGECSEILAAQFFKKYESDEHAFVEPLKEYTLMASSAKELLGNRAKLLHKKAELGESLKSLKAEGQRLQAAAQAPAPAKKSGFGMGMFDKMFDTDPASVLAKNENRIKQTEESIDKVEAQLALASSAAAAEFERFHKAKAADFRKMMLDYCRLQAEFHAKAHETWTSLLPHMESVQTETEPTTAGPAETPVAVLGEVDLN